ncbi:hypothetical protein [Arcobacter aquimarinus]|uniref:hypothetical protein n=1 Tax=Arcobacter aquimarinus TaxID=1315211 RepID=UPI003BAFA59A
MSMKIKDVTKNAVEDGVEDFVNAFLFRRMQLLTKPFLKDFEGDSEFNEAMTSFINTLSMGLTLYAYTKIMDFFFQRGIKIAGSLWTYIVAGAMKKKALEKLKNSNFKGKKLLRTVSMVLGSDRTAERIEVAKMIQSNVNSFDSHKFHYQNQQTKLDEKLDNFSFSGTNLKNTAENSYITRFTHKTLTGTWENNNIDKKLYERATGHKLSETGSGSWSNLHIKLNKYNEFSKTVEGEVTNLATSMQMALSRTGLIR